MPNAKGALVGELSRADQERGMRNLTLAAVAGVAYYYTVYGSALWLFAQRLGADERLLGVLAAIIQMAVILQVPLAREVETRGKKRMVIPAFALAGLFVLPLLLLPLLSAGAPSLRLGLLVATIIVTAVIQQLVIVAWLPLQGDVIPEDIRGRYLGRLQTAWQGAGLLVTIIVAAFLGGNATWWEFRVVFLIGAVSCFGRLFFIRRMPELPPQPAARERGRFDFILEALRDRPFMLFVLLMCLINGMLVLMGPFSILYMRKTLGYGDNFIIIATQALPLAAAILTLILWGHLADRIGNRAIFIFTTIATAATMLVWLVVERGSVAGQYLLAASIFVRGLLQAGFGIALARFLFGALPATNRTGYGAVYTVVMGLAMGATPLLGGVVLSHTRGLEVHLDALGLVLDNYKVMFAVSGLASVLPLVLLKWMRTPGDAPTREFVTFLLARPMRTMMDLFTYHRPLAEAARAAVTRRLATAPTAVTVKELIEGLDDPSYPVREAAAQGLAQTRLPEVIAALTAKLKEQDALVQPSVIWALGELEATEAVQPLIDLLHIPDRHVRAEAALALGKIGRRAEVQSAECEVHSVDSGGPSLRTSHFALRTRGRGSPPDPRSPVVAALEQRWDDEQDLFVCACVATALGRLGRTAFIADAARRLRPETPPAVRRQLATAMGGLLPLADDFYNVLRRETRRRGSAARQMVRRAHQAGKRGLAPIPTPFSESVPVPFSRTSSSPQGSAPISLPSTLRAVWQAYQRRQNDEVIRLAALAAAERPPTRADAAPAGSIAADILEELAAAQATTSSPATDEAALLALAAFCALARP